MYPYSDRPPEDPYRPGNYPQGQYQPPQYPGNYRPDPDPVFPVLRVMGFIFLGLFVFSMVSHVFFLWPLFIFLPMFLLRGRRPRGYRRYYRTPYQWQNQNQYYNNYPPQGQNWPGYNSPQSPQQPPTYGWPAPDETPGEDPRWK